MNAVVAEVMQKISSGRPSDAGASRTVTVSRLANLLSVLRRHGRQMRNDAIALSPPSSPSSETVDHSPLVEVTVADAHIVR